MIQIHNDITQNQATQNGNIYVLAGVVILELVIIVILGAAVTRLWRYRPQ
jgi:hypothetical protein